MRAACPPRLAWKGCAAEQRLLSRLGLAEAARQADLAAQEQGRRAKERRTSSGGAPRMILCSARSMSATVYNDSALRFSSSSAHPSCQARTVVRKQTSGCGLTFSEQLQVPCAWHLACIMMTQQLGMPFKSMAPGVPVDRCAMVWSAICDRPGEFLVKCPGSQDAYCAAGRLGSAPSGERQSEPPTLRRDSNMGLASTGSFTGGPSEQQGQLFSASTADLDLDYFDTLGQPPGNCSCYATCGLQASSRAAWLLKHKPGKALLARCSCRLLASEAALLPAQKHGWEMVAQQGSMCCRAGDQTRSAGKQAVAAATSPAGAAPIIPSCSTAPPSRHRQCQPQNSRDRQQQLSPPAAQLGTQH